MNLQGRYVCIMIIHKSKIINHCIVINDIFGMIQIPFSDVKKALPGISLPRAATRADHLGK